MEEKLKNLEPGLVALAAAVREMPWVYEVAIRRMAWPDVRYEMRAYMSEDPEGMLRDVVPERIDCFGIFWQRVKDVGPCTLILYNSDMAERGYRAKWGLEPMEEVPEHEA